MQSISQETIRAAAFAVYEIFLQDLGNPPVVQHDSNLTGRLYYEELMATENAARFHNSTRMKRGTFTLLEELLTKDGGLSDGVKVCKGEKIMIFIHALMGHTNRVSQERWQHGGATIHDCIVDVIDAMMNTRDNFLVTPDISIPAKISSNPKFFPFFEDCIGALDGSHIPAVVSPSQHQVFRDRKQRISQNVLGVCNFDLIFTYVLCGWEGSAHDGRVLGDAVNKGLHILPGKYYLGDAGYGLNSFVLTPYRGVRYHLKEWKKSKQRPKNREELFNLRHASLRNVVERIFGVTKKQFPILSFMHSYPYDVQCALVMCAFMLHNWIRLVEGYQPGDDDENVDNDDGNHKDGPEFGPGVNTKTAKELTAWRDGIAENMWQSYVEYLKAQRIIN